MPRLTVIIPAANEAALIGPCLAALAAADPGCPAEVIVAANGCTDRTVAIARAATLGPRWSLTVLDLPAPGKVGALNAADRAATGDIRIYLDADVTPAPALIPALVRLLDRPAPAYASGRLNITARGPAARRYARTWARVPFMARGVPGCGLFAMNAAGRARWGDWPQVIADDLFARLNFAPAERHLAPHPYDWPIAEGFAALTRVRRRQDRGVAEIAARFPHLLANEDKLPLGPAGALRLAARDPAGFATYAAVALATKLKRGQGWERSR
jgi:glycosyltransferase involved in cell wall biosynthesis